MPLERPLLFRGLGLRLNFFPRILRPFPAEMYGVPVSSTTVGHGCELRGYRIDVSLCKLELNFRTEGMLVGRELALSLGIVVLTAAGLMCGRY